MEEEKSISRRYLNVALSLLTVDKVKMKRLRNTLLKPLGNTRQVLPSGFAYSCLRLISPFTSILYYDIILTKKTLSIITIDKVKMKYKTKRTIIKSFFFIIVKNFLCGSVMGIYP